MLRLFKTLQEGKTSISLRGKRSQTTQSKFRLREGVFLHSGHAKNGARAKRWKEQGGEGERRELDLTWRERYVLDFTQKMPSSRG